MELVQNQQPVMAPIQIENVADISDSSPNVSSRGLKVKFRRKIPGHNPFHDIFLTSTECSCDQSQVGTPVEGSDEAPLDIGMGAKTCSSPRHPRK
ncbi:hypothetical protein GMRT_jh020 [Giardia muris]|uniref:Uncharacterized protein n=1 Tax=Giardia muris TaxID=5742 RepID=A0A4Z1T064_GIAMU|nr:hypothetical protein GMRT_jh020 [Giardia muris]|eukprot:TNJ26297.1 hypothetical protein GMRT_jh020 [Giardia muris]